MINEVLLFAILLMLEAGGEPWRGKVAVADCVVTRQRRSEKSFTAVMLARKQFSCFNNMRKARKLIKEVEAGKHKNDQAWVACLTLARLAHQPQYRVKTHCTHYFNPRLCSPSWAKGMTLVAKVGNHDFYEE